MTKFDSIRNSISICLKNIGCSGCAFEECGCTRRLLAEAAKLLDEIERGGMVAWHDGSPEVSGEYLVNTVHEDGSPTRFLSILPYSALHDAFNAHDYAKHDPETDIKVYKWAKVLPPNVIEDAE